MTNPNHPHLALVRPVVPRTREGCDCSPGPMKRARGHAAAVARPIVRFLEPGEDWLWCHIDEAYV